MDRKTSIYSPLLRSTVIGLAALLVAAAIASAASSQEDLSSAQTTAAAPIILADAHSYRHCHNLPKRTYCHKKGPLPQNWPPLSNTPHPNEPKAKAPCRNDRAPCGPIGTRDRDQG
jgi:hypothetical protein